MTPDDLKLIIGKLESIQENAAEKQPAPRPSWLEYATFLVSVLALPLLGLFWYLITLKIDNESQKSAISVAAAYVAQPGYNADKQVIWKTLDNHAERLDGDDVKIATLSNTRVQATNSSPSMAYILWSDTNSGSPED